MSYAFQCIIMNHILSQVVLCISVDVSSDYNQVESVIKQVRRYPLLETYSTYNSQQSKCS